MNTGQLYLVSAPSGAGKTSLMQAALDQDEQLVVAISHTTRDKRAAETDGVNYHFTSNDAFTRMVEEGEFLEHAQVFDNQYGTAQKQVDELCEQGKDVILEIDWQGADQVRQLRSNAISIFILPPSIEVLSERLSQRGQDSAQSISRRLAEAQLEISQAPRYDYIVVNDDFSDALVDLLAIFRTQRLTSRGQILGNASVKAILSAS